MKGFIGWVETTPLDEYIIIYIYIYIYVYIYVYIYICIYMYIYICIYIYMYTYTCFFVEDPKVFGLQSLLLRKLQRSFFPGSGEDKNDSQNEEVPEMFHR